VPGFNAVRRFRSLAAPLEHLTMWDVDDAGWPFTPEYKAYPTDLWTDRIGHLRSRSTRTGWEEIETGTALRPAPEGAPAPGIRMVVMDVPPEHADDFNAWYTQDHIPELMQREDYLGIRRFKQLDESRYLALWFLADCHLHSRADFRPAAPSDWGRRVAAYRTGVQHSSWEEIPTVVSGSRG